MPHSELLATAVASEEQPDTAAAVAVAEAVEARQQSRSSIYMTMPHYEREQQSSKVSVQEREQNEIGEFG
jgi:hypothetical protein